VLLFFSILITTDFNLFIAYECPFSAMKCPFSAKHLSCNLIPCYIVAVEGGRGKW